MSGGVIVLVHQERMAVLILPVMDTAMKYSRK